MHERATPEEGTVTKCIICECDLPESDCPEVCDDCVVKVAEDLDNN